MHLPKSKLLNNDSLLITPLKTPQDLKLPIISKRYQSPRRIPKEYQFVNPKGNKIKSNTPSPFHRKIKCYISKDFLANAFGKVQHVTLVKNLTDKYQKELADYILKESSLKEKYRKVRDIKIESIANLD